MLIYFTKLVEGVLCDWRIGEFVRGGVGANCIRPCNNIFMEKQKGRMQYVHTFMGELLFRSSGF